MKRPFSLKKVLAAVTLLLSGLLGHEFARAQAWPDKPVHLIVSFGPGSASDIIARLVANELQNQFGQSFVVENKPGANGVIGTEHVAKARPDGYTLLLSSGTVQSINPHLFKKLPFDPVGDFSAMGIVCTLPYILVVDAKLPIRNFKEFTAYAHSSKPMNYAYANGPGQIGGYLLSKALKVPFLGVPYKSSPQAMTDVVGGHVGFMITDVSSSKPFIQSGGLRPLAIASKTRSRLLPDVPTIEEASGWSNLEMVTWVGISGPAGVDASIVTKVNEGIAKMLKDPHVIKTLANLGAEPVGGTPAEFSAFMTQQLKLWGEKAKQSSILPQ